MLTQIAQAQTIPIGGSISSFYNYSIGIGAAVALGIIVFAGILYSSSAGNVTKQSEAKKWLQAALGGLALLLGSYLLLNTINPQILLQTDPKLAGNTAPSLPTEEIPVRDPESGLIDGLLNFVDSLGSVIPGFPDLSPGGNAPVNTAGKSCPLGNANYSYSNTCGAARPYKGSGSIHLGIDMFVPIGTPVYAAEDGVIGNKFGWNNTGGWRLWVNGNSGRTYYYAHNSAYATGIDSGVKVTAGQIIAFSGDSGYGKTTGGVGQPHLHFSFSETTNRCLAAYNFLKQVCPQ